MMLTNKLVSDAFLCKQDIETVINRQDDSSSGCFKSRNLEGIHCDNQVQRCNIDNNVKVPFDNCLSSHLIQCWGPQYLDEDDEMDNDPLIENKVSKLPVDEALNAQIWQEILEAAEEEPFFLPAHFDIIEMPSANSSSPLVSSESFRHACLMMGLNLISGGFQKVAGWQGISNGSINQSHALSPDFSYNRPLPAHSGYLPFPSMAAGISENQSHRTVGNKDLLGKSFSAEPEDALDKGIASFHGAQAVQRSWLQTSLGLLNKALTAVPFAFLERPLAMFSALTITVLDSAPALAGAEPIAVSFQNDQSQHSNNVTTCQSSPTCTEVLHRLGFSSAELLWLADEKFSSDEKQTVAHQLKRLLTESENHRHKRHHKVDSHTNDANLKKILKYLNRHGIPKTPEQHEKYRAFIEKMHLNKLEKATEAALRTTVGNTGMSVHELKSLFKDHKPLPDSVDEMLQRHFPKTIFSETKKHADLADKCGILEAISPILQLDGAIESLGHHIEHLLQADHMSDAEQKRFRQHFLRTFNDRIRGLSEKQVAALAFKEGFSGSFAAAHLWRKNLWDRKNGEPYSTMSVKEIEGVQIAVELTEIFSGLVPGMAAVTALVDLVTAIQLGQDDICTWLRDGLFIGLGVAAFGEGGGVEEPGVLPEEAEEAGVDGIEKDGIDKSQKEAGVPLKSASLGNGSPGAAIPDMNQDPTMINLQAKQRHLLERLKATGVGSPDSMPILAQLDATVISIGERMQALSGEKPAGHPRHVPPMVQEFVNKHLDKIREIFYQQGMNEALHRAHNRLKGVKEEHRLPIVDRGGERFVHLDVGHRDGLYKLVPDEHGNYRLQHNDHGYFHKDRFSEVDAGKDGVSEKVLIRCRRAGEGCVLLSNKKTVGHEEKKTALVNSFEAERRYDIRRTVDAIQDLALGSMGRKGFVTGSGLLVSDKPTGLRRALIAEGFDVGSGLTVKLPRDGHHGLWPHTVATAFVGGKEIVIDTSVKQIFPTSDSGLVIMEAGGWRLETGGTGFAKRQEYRNHRLLVK